MNERANATTEAMLATAFNLGPIILSITRLSDGRFVEVNERFLQATGYSRAEVIGKTPIELNLWVMPELRREGLQALREGRLVRDVEANFRMKDGTIQTCLMSGDLIELNGEACVLTALTDISEHKQAAAVLERYRLLSSRARDIILFVQREGGRIVEANDAAVAAYGLDRDTLLSKRIHDLRAPGTTDQIAEHMAQADSGGVMFSTFHRRSDGTLFPVEVSSIGTDVAGERLLLSIIRDVSDRERAEAERSELLEREHAARVMAEEAVRRVARMQAIAAGLSVALTPAQVAEVAVDHCIDAFGARRGVVALITADGAGLQFMDVLADAPPNGPRPEAIALDGPHALARAARTQSLVSDRDASPAGRRRYGAQVAVPLIVEERTLGVLGLTFDVPPALSSDDIGLLWSLAHQSAQALFRAQLYEGEQRARSEAEAAVQIRDTFLTTAAHELKTPLTVLLGNVQLLQRRLERDGTLQEREARQLRVVGEQALRLNQLISAMLDISRLETRQLTINKARIDLGALAQRVVDDVRPTLIIHKLVVLLPPEPVLIQADEMRLEQVLHNLLSNATKYSPHGGQITVTLECRDGMAYVAVADQGIGIPAANLPNLFQRFYRADNVDPRQITGVGIGLFVVRAIIELHDGHVGVTSTPGAGSTFTISVPLLAE